MRQWIVPELDDLRVPLERSLDDPSLDTLPAAVNEPDHRYPGRHRGVDVLGNDRRDVGREKVVKIELALDWNPNRAHTIAECRISQPI